jgi:hypothetical protein
MKCFRYVLFFAFLTLNYSDFLYAEEFPFESSEGISFEQAFSEEGGISQKEKEWSLKDRLDIGGSLFSDFYYFTYSTKKFSDFWFYNTNLAYVYLDSKFEKDVRVFIKGRLTYTPTINNGDASPYTGETMERLLADLDELKIMFNAYNQVFFTIGKQKVKFGAAKFWNPSDFLNNRMKNPFYSYDRRLGVSLVKVHVPFGAANAYFIADIEGANNVDQIAYVGRFELPVNVSELSFTVLSRKNKATRLGFDFSTAVSIFDIYVEAGVSKGSDKIFYDQLGVAYTNNRSTFWGISGGISYEFAYSDVDTTILTLEYYYNQEGYEKASMYPILLSKGAFVPLNTGRQYAMFMIYMPKPGGWNDTNISIFNIANLIDSSLISRIELMYMFTKELSIGFNTSVHYGKADGEFRVGGQLLDLGVRFELNF